ncbi:MAG TPA: urocanate hydratase [Gaiellales bacterium]|nr:urocanate hydratase [Gaiellales bacterium]
MAISAERNIKAQRGGELRCKGWRQEAILRMLENNLENAERPEELIVYAGSAKAARDWESFDRIVEALKTMDEDQTLVVQSGKPIGLFRTHRLSPIVVIANGNVVGRWASMAGSQELIDAGLLIFGGMTAGAWQYIGSQGILQGTYETFMAAGRKLFGGSLKGRLVVTAGLGGMGGAQPLAGVLAGAATLIVEVDPDRVDRRLHEGYLQHRSDDLESALGLVLGAKERGAAISVGLVANIADVLDALLERGVIPDIVTDQTTTDPIRGYVPRGMTAAECDELRASDREELIRRADITLLDHIGAMLEFQRRGAEVFEYGNGLRARAQMLGREDAFEMGVFTERYIRPLFCQGIGPFRWLAISGNPQDIYEVDELILEQFEGEPITDWISAAREAVQFTGLPARIGWLGYGDRRKLGLLVNDAVASGRISGPIAFTRDHLDSGSVAAPVRETERMRDGSDGVADWPILNALLNTASHADLVAVHGFGGQAQSAGATTVADGTAQAAERLGAVLTNDPGIGVLRYADAGYEAAIETAHRNGLGF